MKKKILLEICCGSYEDALAAQRGGADRIELNSGLFMGGLTPGMGTFLLVKKELQIPVITMIRPRGAGFCYNEAEKQVMFTEARAFLEAGADGLAFGFLTENREIDMVRTKEMTELIHSFGREAVFHRAVDCTCDLEESVRTLAELCVDRVLTSGGRNTAPEGAVRIQGLIECCGTEIEILAGSGVNKNTVEDLVTTSGVRQVHSSCRTWREDISTQGKYVSYAYAPYPHENAYEAVSEKLVGALAAKCAEFAEK